MQTGVLDFAKVITNDSAKTLPLELQFVYDAADVSLHKSRQKNASNFEANDVSVIIQQIKSALCDHSLFLIGRLLLGTTRVLAVQVDQFESRIQLVMAHIDKVLSIQQVPKERKGPRAPNSSKRLTNHRAVTLAVIPETSTITSINLEDVLFDNTIVPLVLPPPAESVNRTPGSDSSRKRRLSSSLSTPSRQRIPSSPFENIMMTPDGFSLESDDEETRKRARRMSSISEVMDSLREDDGSRRLSGLIGSRQPRDSILTTAGNSNAQSPEDLFDEPQWDHDDHAALLQTPLQPVSLLQLTSGSRTRLSGRRSLTSNRPTIKSLMDKKGKRGIELDLSTLTKRRNQMLEYTQKNGFYLTTKKPQQYIVFAVADFYRDISSHFRWYVPQQPVVIASRPKRQMLLTRPSPDDTYEAPMDPASFDDMMLPSEPTSDSVVNFTTANPKSENSFLSTIARAKKPVPMNLAFTNSSPQLFVADLVKSLHYVSEGVLRFDHQESSQSTTTIDLNSIRSTNVFRGPRWESFIMST